VRAPRTASFRRASTSGDFNRHLFFRQNSPQAIQRGKEQRRK
jgi:hypothetical protein